MSRVDRLLLNDPGQCVDEMLQSISMQNPGQRLLKGHRVVIREDVENFRKKGLVSLVCGGGSGHEPFAAGFVGEGMLTAAVAGSIFASPPPNDILAAIKAVASPAGVLLIVANYTGDRLNFGIALERALALKLKVKMVVVGEDCALESQDKTAGKRGLVGIVAVMKIAGALSEMGKSLDYVVQVATRAASAMGTIGVSLGGCSVPGSGSSFVLDPTEMELGLGVHGEAGIKRLKILSADDTIVAMINHMTNPQNASHIRLQEGDQISLIFNNLGGLSVLEMHVLARKAILFLKEKLLTVVRVYFGHLMTSLDMSGFNLNILKLDEEILICLDASTNAPNWPTLCKSQVTGYDINSISLYLAAKEDADFDSEQKEQVDAACDPTINAVLKAITNACQALIANEVQLNELDTLAGDGDCGSTIKRGATDILDKCETWKALSIDKILLNIASSAEETMGGASGGLYSLFFTAAAGLAKDLNMATICDCLQAGVNAVSKYGGAEPGDRTMLDALTAAHSSLQNQIKKKSSPKEVAKVVSKACCDAAESTANMKARAGRASYVASNLLAKPDAGAVAVSIWIEAFAKTLAV